MIWPALVATTMSAMVASSVSPDDRLDAPATAAFLTADALAGALIGKIGGSTGTIKGATIFLVGSESVIEVDDKTQGPLYLTINDIPAGMKDNSGSLKVTISDSL